MFPKSNTYVDDEIARITIALRRHEVSSKEYGDLLSRLETLHNIRQEEKPERATTDTILKVAGNLVGILMIIKHERLNVITSKAVGLLVRVR